MSLPSDLLGLRRPTTSRLVLIEGGVLGMELRAFDMLRQPAVNIFGTPQQPLCARKPANRRERLGIAGRIAANTGNRFMKTLGQLIDSKKGAHTRSPPAEVRTRLSSSSERLRKEASAQDLPG